MTEEVSIITDLEEQIRQLINAPRKHQMIFKDPVEFHKLCSCLDVIGDTELALHAYEDMSNDRSPGSNYILAYGFLQALFLQQDAVSHLYEALQLPPSESNPLLTEIRELRNDAIGHPTKRGRGKGKRFSYISRISISRTGFTLMTVEPNKDPPMFRDVRFKVLLEVQHTELEKALFALLQALRKEDMEHRKKFRNEKLAELFPATLTYYFEKVYEAARESGGGWEFGTLHISLIGGVIEKFRTTLDRRQIAGAYSGVEYQLKRLAYPLAELDEYFKEKGAGRLNANDAEIFIFFLQEEMLVLKKMACELDADYAAEPQ